MSEKVAIICPLCKKSGKVAELALGRLVSCPACGHKYTARAASEMAPAVADPLDDRDARPAPSPHRPGFSPGAQGRPAYRGPSRGSGLGSKILVGIGIVMGVFVVIGVAAGFLAAALGRSSKWDSVSPPGSGFTVMMPGKVTPSTNNEALPGGGQLVHHRYQSDLGSFVYVVDYCDLDGEIPNLLAPIVLNRVRDQNVQQYQLQVLSERDVQLDGHPGRERVQELTNPSISGTVVRKEQNFIAGRRFFILLALRKKGVRETQAMADADRFLTSFRITSTPSIPKPLVNAPPPRKDAAPPPIAKAPADRQPSGANSMIGPDDANPRPDPASLVLPEYNDPTGPPVALKYAWEPGQSYLYDFKYAIEGAGLTAVQKSGLGFYKVSPGTDEGMSISYLGKLDSVVPPGGKRSQTISTTMTVDAKGEPIHFTGRTPLPLICDLAELVFEPLEDGPSAEWSRSREVTLSRIQDARALGTQRIAGKSQAPNPSPSRRPPANARARNRMAMTPGNAPNAGNAMDATIKADYRLGAASGDVVPIFKTYSLTSAETKPGSGPRIEVNGRGKVEFDAARGLPISLEFRAVATVRGDLLESTVPISASYRLLEGDDRDKAMREKGIRDDAR